MTPGAVRRELQQILERFDAADRRMLAARKPGDKEAAEAERREVMADFYGGSEALADLLLLLLRHAGQRRTAALRAALLDLLAPELRELAGAVAALERRRR
jgi:hypothetical protein